MVFDSLYWKQELLQLDSEIQNNSQFASNLSDVENTQFLLERALIYSAFVSRLLMDAEKLSDSIRNFCFTVLRYENIQENPNTVLPLLRKYPDREIYNFDDCDKKSISASYLINQIIHSFVILTFCTNENNNVIGFLTSSDYDANSFLYYVQLSDWKKFIRKVAVDDITRMESHYDEQKGLWITKRY